MRFGKLCTEINDALRRIEKQKDGQLSISFRLNQGYDTLIFSYSVLNLPMLTGR
jgi:hypothetical protein